MGPRAIKSECPLTLSQSWHMMKNQNFSYSSQRYPRVSLETWCDFFLKYFFNLPKKSKIRYDPTPGQKHANFSDWYLIKNFALFNPRQNNTSVWAWKFIFEEFTSLLRPIILLWVNFQGHDEPLKITKIRFLKILNYAHIFNRQIRYPVKYQNTLDFNV